MGNQVFRRRKQGFLFPDYTAPDLDKAKLVIWPIAYEKTTSYGKGTAKGPEAIIRASSYLEMLDEETGGCPCSRGMTTVNTFRPSHASHGRNLARLERAACELLDSGKRILALGGEHSISQPLIAAHLKHGPLTVLQLDAHADLRSSYEGSRQSHACVMRRITDMCPAVQVGIRSLSLPEYEESRSLPTRIFWAHDIAKNDGWMDRAVSKLGDRVYLTLDIDVLDPSLMPATGTPEPGGMDWQCLIRFLRKVAGEREIVGADLVEFSPIRGFPAPNFTAAKLAYKLVGTIRT